MHKNTFIAGIIIAASLSVPFAASALSIDDLQQQIKDLLARVSALQAQIKQQTTATTSVTSDASTVDKMPRFCGVLKRSLALGQSGDDVRGLQEFLADEGYLNANATGYFGNATQVALRNWQFENGVIAKITAGGSGRLGPATIEKIKIRCGLGNELLSVSPKSGSAPLRVTVTAKTGDNMDYRPSMVDGQDTLIDFGDGSERQWIRCATSPADIYPSRCVTPVSFEHTYAKDGTYIVSIVRAGGMCMGGCKESILASEKVSVGSQPVACTKEYAPVCGAKPVVCITTPCNPVPTTYSNSCMMKADGATLLYSGSCKDTTENPETNGQCKAWFDGCNSCGRSEPGGPAFCTLKYCAADSMQKPYCTAYFDDTTGNKPPVVSSFSGPVTLAVNEVGTWKITASDPENGELKYTIMWGDEWVPATDASRRMMAPSASVQQQTTFTHSFSRPGVYNVSLTVSDKEGKEARSTATVNVSQTACTADYTPVCGRPQGCANTCPPGMYCTMQCQLHQPQTYSNRCQLNNSNADFIHEGVCTGTETY